MEVAMANTGKREAKAPKSGKGSAILARVTQELRQAIDAEAERTGRSISQVVELWLEQARALGDPGAAGTAVADALQSMLRAVHEIRRTMGPPTASVEARDALRSRWVEIAQKALPYVETNSAQTAAEAAISAMRFAAISAYDFIAENGPIDKPELRDVPNRLLDIGARAKLHPGSPTWPEARSELQAAANIGGAIGDSLKALIALADAAAQAVAIVEANHERS
jgi:hypothetical protein